VGVELEVEEVEVVGELHAGIVTVRGREHESFGEAEPK
jgi:hypothetical protein